MLEHAKKPFYSLGVRVRDQGVPPLETIHEVRVEVVDLDDDASPAFTRSKFNFKVSSGPEFWEFGMLGWEEPQSLPLLRFQVSENGGVGESVGTVTGPEDESGGDKSRLAFVILRGNTDESFVIDKSTGGLYVAKELNFELCPHYLLQVQALDSTLTASLLQVSIDVIDENEPPLFPQDPVTFSLPEDTPVGTGLWNFSAVDGDDGLNGLLHYRIEEQGPEEKFRINMLSGTLYLQAPLDYETQASHFLVISATDQALDPNKRLNATITLQINTGTYLPPSIHEFKDGQLFWINLSFCVLNPSLTQPRSIHQYS
jgi:protocadherin-16/23